MDLLVVVTVIAATLIVTYIVVQLLKGKCHSTVTLEGKTVIVTGANTGTILNRSWAEVKISCSLINATLDF